jgi:hypothetical protein
MEEVHDMVELTARVVGATEDDLFDGKLKF